MAERYVNMLQETNHEGDRALTRHKKSLLEKGKLYFSMKTGYLNSHRPRLFRMAYIDFKQFDLKEKNICTDTVKGIELSDLFSRAFEKVSSHTKDGLLSKDAKVALEYLNTFLRDYRVHEAAINSVREGDQYDSSKGEYCVMLAAHLFSTLTPDGRVTTSKLFYTHSHRCRCGCNEIKSVECPCECGQEITLDHTGIGHQRSWQGYPEIMVGQTSIAVCDPTDEGFENDEDYLCDGTGLIKQRRDIRDIVFSTELASQTISNAFAQQRASRLKGHTGHIFSTIGCTREDIVVMFYDPDHDLLVRRKYHMPRFIRSELVLSTVVEIWFILNLHCFDSKVAEGVYEELGVSGVKSFFQQHNVLHFYRESVTDAKYSFQKFPSPVENEFPTFLDLEIYGALEDNDCMRRGLY